MVNRRGGQYLALSALHPLRNRGKIDYGLRITDYGGVLSWAPWLLIFDSSGVRELHMLMAIALTNEGKALRLGTPAMQETPTARRTLYFAPQVYHLSGGITLFR